MSSQLLKVWLCVIGYDGTNFAELECLYSPVLSWFHWWKNWSIGFIATCFLPKHSRLALICFFLLFYLLSTFSSLPNSVRYLHYLQHLESFCWFDPLYQEHFIHPYAVHVIVTCGDLAILLTFLHRVLGQNTEEVRNYGFSIYKRISGGKWEWHH